MMNHRRNTEKLAELRAKTDRQLLALIASTVNRGLRVASALPAEAEIAYSEACALLQLIAPSERERATHQLARLRNQLHVSTLAAC